MDFAGELIKVFGPAGLTMSILMWVINEAKKRETQKDSRIQLLENKLAESYDERIAAADQITAGNHAVAKAIDALTQELRQRRGR